MSGYSGGSDGLNPPVDDEQPVSSTVDDEQPVSGDVQQSLLKRVDELEEKMGAATFDEKRVQGLIADDLDLYHAHVEAHVQKLMSAHTRELEQRFKLQQQAAARIARSEHVELWEARGEGL